VVPEKQCFVLPPEIDDMLGTQVETLATRCQRHEPPIDAPVRLCSHPGLWPIGYLFAQFAKNIASQSRL